MTDPLILTRRVEGVEHITLNRPHRHNALVPELLRPLRQALEAAAESDAEAVLLRAEGRSFSTGGDLLGFRQHRENIADYADELVGLLNDCIMALNGLPCPVACAVQGQVTGGSLGFLLACDRVFMSRQASITPFYTMVGFSPDGGWTALLPKLIGRQKTMHWLLTNVRHEAGTCRELGIVHEVVGHDPTAAAWQWIATFRTTWPGARRRVRELLRSDANALRARLDAERESFVAQIQSAEALEGIDHFLGNN